MKKQEMDSRSFEIRAAIQRMLRKRIDLEKRRRLLSDVEWEGTPDLAPSPRACPCGGWNPHCGICDGRGEYMPVFSIGGRPPSPKRDFIDQYFDCEACECPLRSKEGVWRKLGKHLLACNICGASTGDPTRVSYKPKTLGASFKEFYSITEALTPGQATELVKRFLSFQESSITLTRKVALALAKKMFANSEVKPTFKRIVRPNLVPPRKPPPRDSQDESIRFECPKCRSEFLSRRTLPDTFFKCSQSETLLHL